MSDLDKLLDNPMAAPVAGSSPESAPAISEKTMNGSLAPVRGGALDSAMSIDGMDPEIRVRVTSLRHTILSSQASGRIDSVTVRNGDRFRKGDLLVAIDPTFERIQLDRARANLRRQELVLEMTQELVRLQTRGELELELAKADIAQAGAEVSLISTRLERMRITAPFDGRAGEVAVREFQIVAEGQPLLEIIDEDSMELEFIVPSAWMRWFAPGFRFAVHIDELDKTYQAVLKRLGGKVDPLSKSVNAYAEIVESDGLLMEGMSGEAFINPPEEGGE